MLARALATNKIHNLLITKAARKERKEASNKVVQKYKEIYKHQAQREIFLDEEDEKEVVNMQNSQLSKPWKKKYKEVIKELVLGFADIRLKSTFTSAYTRN
jgi:histone acetyltransferase (RNA polymerase elongator complex component)